MTTSRPSTTLREPWTSIAVKLGRLAEQRMQRTLARHGVSVSQFMALSHVAARPGINRADLARALEVTPQAVGRVIAALVDEGLLAPSASQRGRALALQLTPAGHDTLRQAELAVESLSRQLLLKCVSGEAVASIDGAFRHILSRLSRYRTVNPMEASGNGIPVARGDRPQHPHAPHTNGTGGHTPAGYGH